MANLNRSFQSSTSNVLVSQGSSKKKTSQTAAQPKDGRKLEFWPEH